MSTPLTAAQARPRRQPKSVDRLDVSVDGRAMVSSARPKRSRQRQTALVSPAQLLSTCTQTVHVSPAHFSTCTQTVLATERDHAYSDVLSLIFFHVFASKWASGVKAIPVLRLVCVQWARCLQEQIRTCNRLCVVSKDRYDYDDRYASGRNPFAPQPWLLFESEPMHRDGCEDCAWWLVRGPPRTLSELPKWHAMMPVLNRLCVFELGSFDILPRSSSKQRWESLLELLEGLAWLPVLASVTLVEEEEHICPSDNQKYETFLDGLKLRLSRLQHVHTLKGGLGFIDQTGPNVYGCLVDMPSLRHVELYMSWASCDNQDQHFEWFKEMVRALSSLRLETLKGLYSPDGAFWTGLITTKQDRLRELEFNLGSFTDPPEVSELFAVIFDALCAMPELQVVTITGYDLEFNGVFEDGSMLGKREDEAIDGWQTMRAMLLRKLTKRLTGDGDETVYRSYMELLSKHAHCHNELFEAAVRCCHPNAVVNP